MLLHTSLLQWHGLVHCILHGHLHCSLLRWHGLLLLLWPWLYLQLLHCSLQCYCLLLQCSLLLAQRSLLLLLPLAKCGTQLPENFCLHRPFLQWLLLLPCRWA